MFRLMRIHTVPAEAEGTGSTWLHLFFDLVYVAILVELGNRLSHDLTIQGTIEFAFLFVPIWWSWLEFVQYGRYFPIDDIGQRILTVLYMGFMLLMAFEIHDVTGETATAFLIAYAFSKIVLALMYARAWYLYPEYRAMASHHVIGFLTASVFWLSIALFAPTTLWLWGIATLFGVLMPVLIHLLRRLLDRAELASSKTPYPPSKNHYLLHRFGELTIIVLGEFFIKLATSSADREVSRANIFIGLSLLGTSVSLWWLYFDHLEHASLSAATSRVGLWVYSHYPFLLGITAYGVVGNKIFASETGQALEDSKRLLFTIALALALLAYGFIEWTTKEKGEALDRKPQPWVRIGGAVALLALGFWGGGLNMGVLVLLVFTIFIIQVGLDVYKRLSPAPAAG